MERMFSKPFIAALEGHADAVEVLSRRPNSITDVASASWDGGAFSVQKNLLQGKN
jgi:DDB1- and CUL4-associated factor 13